MTLTIIAYADMPDIRIEPLLWALATRGPKIPFRLLIIDRNGEPDPSLLEQLGNYRTNFEWALLRAGGEDSLQNFVEGAYVVYLPASAVPIDDALENLRAPDNCETIFHELRCIGPLALYAMNEMCDNLSDVEISNCQILGSFFSERIEDWIEDLGNTMITRSANGVFVLTAIPKEIYSARPKDPVTLIATNVPDAQISS
jgi:hypothetical protein